MPKPICGYNAEQGEALSVYNEQPIELPKGLTYENGKYITEPTLKAMIDKFYTVSLRP